MIVLSHEEQLVRLRRDCPSAADVAVVAGDLVYDRIVASKPLRASYRRAFGIAPEQNLVVVSSTWGQDSLLETCPDLPRRLAEQLPADEFTILLALHPNIVSKHSQWSVSTWLAAARRAGVHILDDVDEWRAALVAADLTIGDQGSVSFYSAGLGTPLLLACAPGHTVGPDSPIAAMLAAAPALDSTTELAAQVRAALTGADDGRLRAITDLATSQPGLAAARLRTVFCQVLGLAEPESPPDIDVIPLPTTALAQASAHLVWVRRTGPRSAVITRLPAERLRDDPRVARGHHLAVRVDEPRRRWLELADLIIGAPGENTAEWITDTLARLPGALLAIAPDAARWLLGDRDGTVLAVTGPGTGPTLFASAAYTWVGDGAPVTDLAGEWLITAGAREYRITVEPITASR
ncbi:hypothetical protein [Actinokineospora sp.]|uniref:hypothetical protein n=1 Tax=Actinokineospora sp. TaxID=1872133 RepID=UPI00403784B6